MIHSGLPKEHLEIIAIQEQIEREVLAKDATYAKDKVAQILTCLAHDYIQMGLEEKGHELLLKADEVYPGYHGQKMSEHMKGDPDFTNLVVSLSRELILVALSTARDGK